MPAEKPNPPPGDLEVPEALAPWWRVPLFVWPLLVVVIGGLFAAFGARPAWRMVKERRADKILVKGEQLLAEGKLGPAIDQCRLAFQLTPESPRALRLMAESLTQAGARGGLDYWQRLLAKPEATLADRESFAELALREGFVGMASNEVVRLLDAPDPSPRARMIGVRYHLLRNDTNAALALSRELLRHDPNNPTNLLTAAFLLQARADPASRSESRAILWQVVSNLPNSRIDAWEYLVRGPSAQREDREHVAADLAALPSLSIREQVLLADARMLLDPSQTRAIANTALDTIDPRSDAERLSVVLWLHRHRLYDLSLPLLALNQVRAKPALFRARAEALIAQNRAEAAYRELLGENSGIEPLDLELLRFRAAEVLKDSESAARHRDQLMRTAARDPDRLRRVADFAERSRLPELAIEAWKRLADDRYESRRALRSLATLADQSGDTWAARESTRRLAKIETDNPALVLQLAHYDLLLGEDPAPALKTAEALVGDPTHGNDARFVSALALLRSGDAQRAAATLRGIVYDAGPIPTPLRVILAAVAGGTGDSNQAAEIARALPLSQLRPEERELIRPYLVMPRLPAFSTPPTTPP